VQIQRPCERPVALLGIRRRRMGAGREEGRLVEEKANEKEN